jgi:SAM-dependent methyltransferase
MTKREKKSSRELGLEVAAICGKHFLRLDHLHYGYWTNGLEIDIANLHDAQEKYTDFLIEHIPAGVRTILDVGCGPGQTAKRLIHAGYDVACVSPSPFLSERVRALLGDGCKIFESTYEGLETDHRYDVILFSESFQYVRMEKALQKTLTLLNDPGHLLICDIFKKDVEASSVMGGGHKLAKFYRIAGNYPFEFVEDLDITEQTAPNLDILDDALKNVAQPVLNSVLSYLRGRYPLIVKFLQWKYRKQINKTCEKYFKDGRASEDFKKFKSYRLLLMRKNAPARVPVHGG